MFVDISKTLVSNFFCNIGLSSFLLILENIRDCSLHKLTIYCFSLAFILGVKDQGCVS